MFSFLHAPLTLSLSPLARSVCVCVCVCVCVFSHVQDHTPKQFQTFSLHMFSHTCLSPLCLSLPVGSDRYADMFSKSRHSIRFYSILFYSVLYQWMVTEPSSSPAPPQLPLLRLSGLHSRAILILQTLAAFALYVLVHKTIKN